MRIFSYKPCEYTGLFQFKLRFNSEESMPNESNSTKGGEIIDFLSFDK